MITDIKKKISSFALCSLILGGVFTSCSEDINLGKADESKYGKAENTYVALKNYEDPRSMRTVDFRGDESQIQVYFKLSQPLAEVFTGKLKIDQSFLDEYNKKNNTSFQAFPSDLVTIGDNSTVTVAAGKTESDPVTITLKRNSSLTVGTSYVLPISFDSQSNPAVKASTGEDNYLFVIKYMGDIPNNAKASGIVTIMYFEVNNTNILNAGEYTLKNSGKQFVDIVTIFAANINYNKETGRVYVNFNENVSHILANRDKYIKPLQDKGIRVNLSILGNHDAAGVANMSESTAKDFAKELKAIVDAYGLDGIDFDDEYSKYEESIDVPGFVYPSPDAYARLCYETKKIMPDKTVTVYNYGNIGFFNQIDGQNPGSFIDYSLEAFYGYFDDYIQEYYLGMTKKQVSPYSRKLVWGLSLDNEGYGFDVGTYSIEALEYLRSSGYGVNMLYDFNPENDYVPAFNDYAKVLYDDEIVFTGKTFNKDW